MEFGTSASTDNITSVTYTYVTANCTSGTSYCSAVRVIIQTLALTP